MVEYRLIKSNEFERKEMPMFDKEKEFNRLIKLGYSATSAIALISNADYCAKREEELKGKQK